MKSFSALGLIALVVLISTTCSGAIYYGNQYGQQNTGAISGGTLDITESGQNLTLTLTRGGAAFDDVLVIYFDSIPNAGVTGTGGLNDTQTTATRLISGIGSSGRSGVNFASGLAADFALVLSPTALVSDLYSLANGGDGSMQLVRHVTLNTDNASAPSFSTAINWGNLGQGTTSTHGFAFQSTYMHSFGLRYSESFEHPTSGYVSGYNTITFTDYSVYGVDPVPEPANIALAIFGGLAITGTAAARIRKHLAARRQAS